MEMIANIINRIGIALAILFSFLAFNSYKK